MSSKPLPSVRSELVLWDLSYLSALLCQLAGSACANVVIQTVTKPMMCAKQVAIIPPHERLPQRRVSKSLVGATSSLDAPPFSLYRNPCCLALCSLFLVTSRLRFELRINLHPIGWKFNLGVSCFLLYCLLFGIPLCH